MNEIQKMIIPTLISKGVISADSNGISIDPIAVLKFPPQVEDQARLLS